MTVKKETIARYARHLKNFGCVFKIIEEDGTSHGTLEVVSETPRKPRVKVLRNIDYKSALNNLRTGDVIELSPTDDVPIESLRSAVASYSSLKFGNGKITTSVNRKTNVLEILRLED